MKTLNQDDQLPPSEFATRLLADRSGALCAEYRRLMEQAVATGAERLRHPLEQREYAATRALVESAAVSVEVLQNIWDGMHLNPR
ncbi:hypothetical protein GM658_18600 [Pseudoduganella eburnea]|uniref:EscE/YscE/SsaE family type III secretion system needle protein co-chaperone n=1 Tax=Massilia eburnea TaxID=1776165 RepID=A0A6L6QLZ9_9BURK|nr:hypothetical protein [Massilia eburnea]MTW12623.1 hypothetical protein [Massilia eburnea]